jgi:hypothetical protein
MKLSMFINLAFNENLLQPILRVLGNLLASQNEITEIKQYIMNEISNPTCSLLYIFKLKIGDNYSPVIKEIIWFIKNVSIINKDFFLVFIMPFIGDYLNYTDKILLNHKENTISQLFTMISINSNIYQSDLYRIFSDLTVLCYLYIVTVPFGSINLNIISPYLRNLLECLPFTKNDIKLKIFVYEIMKFLLKAVSVESQQNEIFLNDIENKLQYYPK